MNASSLAVWQVEGSRLSNADSGTCAAPPDRIVPDVDAAVGCGRGQQRAWSTVNPNGRLSARPTREGRAADAVWQGLELPASWPRPGAAGGSRRPAVAGPRDLSLQGRLTPSCGSDRRLTCCTARAAGNVQRLSSSTRGSASRRRSGMPCVARRCRAGRGGRGVRSGLASSICTTGLCSNLCSKRRFSLFLAAPSPMESRTWEGGGVADGIQNGDLSC